MKGIRRRVTFARTAAAKAGSWSWAGVSGAGGGPRGVRVRESAGGGGAAGAAGSAGGLEFVLVRRPGRHALRVGDVARRHPGRAHPRRAPDGGQDAGVVPLDGEVPVE